MPLDVMLRGSKVTVHARKVIITDRSSKISKYKYIITSASPYINVLPPRARKRPTTTVAESAVMECQCSYSELPRIRVHVSQRALSATSLSLPSNILYTFRNVNAFH